MREDEIEALLKLDGAYLIVEPDLPGKGDYTAVIHRPNKEGGHSVRLAKCRNHRVDAVRAVWEVYNECLRSDTLSGNWMFKFAMADVDLQLIQNRRDGIGSFQTRSNTDHK